MHVVVFSESVFHIENLLYPPDISFSAFYVLYSDFGPLLVPRTPKHEHNMIDFLAARRAFTEPGQVSAKAICCTSIAYVEHFTGTDHASLAQRLLPQSRRNTYVLKRYGVKNTILCKSIL